MLSRPARKHHDCQSSPTGNSKRITKCLDATSLHMALRRRFALRTAVSSRSSFTRNEAQAMIKEKAETSCEAAKDGQFPKINRLIQVEQSD